jgi:hypothetical protein
MWPAPPTEVGVGQGVDSCSEDQNPWANSDHALLRPVSRSVGRSRTGSIRRDVEGEWAARDHGRALRTMVSQGRVQFVLVSLRCPPFATGVLHGVRVRNLRRQVDVGGTTTLGS